MRYEDFFLGSMAPSSFFVDLVGPSFPISQFQRFAFFVACIAQGAFPIPTFKDPLPTPPTEIL